MDRIKQYSQMVVELLTHYAALTKEQWAAQELEEQLILDTDRHHYQLLTLGWNGTKRIYYPTFHIDLKNGKIWIQEDATDFDLVGELEKRGVPKSDIVLAFHSPQKRPFTGYAAQ